MQRAFLGLQEEKGPQTVSTFNNPFLHLFTDSFAHFCKHSLNTSHILSFTVSTGTRKVVSVNVSCKELMLSGGKEKKKQRFK